MKVKCKPRTFEAIKYDGSNYNDIVDLIGSDIQINVGCWVVLDELSKPKRFFIESQASFSLNYSIVEEWV